ncbi:MAG: Hpt domain-containing protein [Bacteroidetes bacterium]|jgi:HPt (histidine-containing phosphotransfer) domain-containing protein|nr:Hpt domain-containing protein [Bacteroidota bacterium]MCL5034329.1 Hpt domain-containing protein [Bacteroidota bacterium]
MKDKSFENIRALAAADMPGQIAVLEAAICDANRDTVRTTSHQISGRATSFGCTDISALASELERSVEKTSLSYSVDSVNRIYNLSVL